LQTLFKVSLTSLFCRKGSIPLSLPHGPLVIADQPSLVCGSLCLARAASLATAAMKPPNPDLLPIDFRVNLQQLALGYRVTVSSAATLSRV
jgi:hypothetical protein